MVRSMQDSDITSGFEPGADIYAAYVLSDTGEGHSNYAQTVAAFPSAKHLSICTRFNASAQCLDFEASTTGTSVGDAQQCVQWVQRMRAQGFEPTVYVQLSLWDWLAGVFDTAGVPRPGWWVAHWTGTPHLEAGSDATQWQGGSLVDRNTAADYWPTVDGLDPSGGGTPIPVPVPVEEEPMSEYILDDPAGGSWWVVNGYKATIQPELLNQLLADGIKRMTVVDAPQRAAQLAALPATSSPWPGNAEILTALTALTAAVKAIQPGSGGTTNVTFPKYTAEFTPEAS